MTTELILAENGELIPPNGNAEQADRLCAYIHARKGELLAVCDGIAVTDAAMTDKAAKKALKTQLADLAKAVEDLRDKGKKLVEASVAATEAQRVLTQIDPRLWSYSTKGDPMSAYAVLSDALKAKKAEIQAWEDAHTPPEPEHTYCLQLQCTDKALKAVTKALEKAGVDNYRVAAPQSDKAFKALEKWFTENN